MADSIESQVFGGDPDSSFGALNPISQPAVLCFGSLNTDYVYRVPRISRAGETVASTGRREFCGGKGLNQSVAMARAGARTYHAGAAGLDGGDALVDRLRRSGVDTRFVARREGPCGHTVIQVDEEGQNSILLFGGANLQIGENDIARAISAFGNGDYLAVQNEISLVADIMRCAKLRGMRVALNPSPLDDAALALPYELCDLLIVNAIEAETLVLSRKKTPCTDALATLDANAAANAAPSAFDAHAAHAAHIANAALDAHTAPSAKAPSATSGHDAFDALAALDALASYAPNAHIALTLGKGGAYLQAPRGGERLFHEAFDVRVVDTTGAGDTFAGYLIAGFSAGLPLKKALSRASAAAGISVSRPGAEPSVPWATDVDAFLYSRGEHDIPMDEELADEELADQTI